MNALVRNCIRCLNYLEILLANIPYYIFLRQVNYGTKSNGINSFEILKFKPNDGENHPDEHQTMNKINGLLVTKRTRKSSGIYLNDL